LPRFPWSRKPWDKVACNYVLQEYTPGHGWSDITEPAGEAPTVDECREHFKPGSHYRLMARAVEDSLDAKIKGGTFVGVLWKYYEPLPGGVVAVVKEKPKVEKPSRPKDATETMKEYVGEVRRVLEPITDIFVVMNELRDSIFPPGEGAPSGEGGGSQGYSVPPPEFEGKIPVWMHPYVVHTIADEMKGVIEYGATRLEGVLGKRGPPGMPPEEEEEEVRLPSIRAFVKPVEAAEKPEAPEGIEEKEVEERVEEEAVVEEEEEEEVEGEETVPSLIEEKPCASCGKVVPLLPSGICENCAKNLAAVAEEHERALEESAWEVEEESEAEVEEEEEAGE